MVTKSGRVKCVCVCVGVQEQVSVSVLIDCISSRWEDTELKGAFEVKCQSKGGTRHVHAGEEEMWWSIKSLHYIFYFFIYQSPHK